MQLIVYGQPSCNGCNQVKSFLRAKELPYEYVDITTEKGWMAFESDFPGARSVPRTMVIENDIAFGIIGYEGLVKYVNNGA
jgi:glutaredoxin